MTRAGARTLPTSPTGLRIYDEARTAHLERLAADGTVRLLYRRESYDFDRTLAAGLAVRQTGRMGAIVEILTTRPEHIELNEPAYVAAWPSLTLYLLAAKLSALFQPGSPTVAAYAIENGDPVRSVATKLHLPERLSRRLVSGTVAALFRQYSRIAFGTPGSFVAYVALVGGRTVERTPHRVFQPLEPACARCEPLYRSPSAGRVLFVGALEERKGLLALIDAWPLALAAQPSLRLKLLGTGPLAPMALQWAAGRREVSVVIEPSRDQIHEEMARASLLVLLSQRTATWREQIGLPLLEALSHGCTVIASTETGLAGWLESHNHAVLPPDVSPASLAAVIATRAVAPLPSGEVLASLPAKSGRAAADEWLTHSASEVRGN